MISLVVLTLSKFSNIETEALVQILGCLIYATLLLYLVCYAGQLLLQKVNRKKMQFQFSTKIFHYLQRKLTGF